MICLKSYATRGEIHRHGSVSGTCVVRFMLFTLIMHSIDLHDIDNIAEPRKGIILHHAEVSILLGATHEPRRCHTGPWTRYEQFNALFNVSSIAGNLDIIITQFDIISLPRFGPMKTFAISRFLVGSIFTTRGKLHYQVTLWHWSIWA